MVQSNLTFSGVTFSKKFKEKNVEERISEKTFSKLQLQLFMGKTTRVWLCIIYLMSCIIFRIFRKFDHSLTMMEEEFERN